ncbi:MAG: phosphatase PAP2 family protein [Alicyclobacillaceae bacterium]|nr:phosphatase PAP2 family protein [Alicyclobacillaceae bacterium]
MRFRYHFAESVLVGGAFAFVCLGIAVGAGMTETFDQQILEWFGDRQSERVTQLMKMFTAFGSWVAVLAAFLLVSVWIYSRSSWHREFPFLVWSVAGASLLNVLLKWGFQRPRPWYGLVTADGYSFPSGHAMEAFVLYGTLGILLWSYVQSPAVKMVLILVLAAVVIAVGISRVYLGVHYPTDVLGGYMAGAAWLSFCVRYFRRRPDSRPVR